MISTYMGLWAQWNLTNLKLALLKCNFNVIVIIVFIVIFIVIQMQQTGLRNDATPRCISNNDVAKESLSAAFVAVASVRWSFSRADKADWPIVTIVVCAWWRHQMDTFSASLAICAGNSPVTSEVPAQRPVTRSFDVFVDLHLNKRLSKQSWSWWFETPSRPLWRHCNVERIRFLDQNITGRRVKWGMIVRTYWGIHTGPRHIGSHGKT